MYWTFCKWEVSAGWYLAEVFACATSAGILSSMAQKPNGESAEKKDFKKKELAFLVPLSLSCSLAVAFTTDKPEVAAMCLPRQKKCKHDPFSWLNTVAILCSKENLGLVSFFS